MSRFSLRQLKTLRVIVALLFFIPLSLLFLDPRQSIPPSAIALLVSLQFLPAITKGIVYTGVTTFGVLFVLALTILFGRVYCSTLCPLGTVQDIVIRIEKKIHRRKRYSYVASPFRFHYIFLGITTIVAIAGSMTLLNLFEPFSNFGRILTNLIEPEVIFINNVFADIFEHFNVFVFYHVTYRESNIPVLFAPLLFLGVIVFMSYKHGRLFCNSLCPTGALLSLLSRISLFRIVINESACNECGACERVCKARCILSEAKRIDYSACINCFNCITSCPTDGVVYRAVLSRTPARANKVNKSRRSFFKDVSTTFIGLTLPTGLVSDSTKGKNNNYFQEKTRPVTPPGSRGVAHFSSLCTACHLCVSACPTQVLTPSLLDYGIAGFLQPKMNYDASYCNYDCVICSQVCPSGAILPVETGTKKLIQIGKANFFRDDCVVVTKKKDCAACSEHCPTKAVHTVPYEGKLLLPEVNNEICVGCGACEHACPTSPRKAIYVSSNSIHLPAKKPAVKKQEPMFDPNQDFPF